MNADENENLKNQRSSNEFIKDLYAEKISHKEHRHTFVKQKLVFIAGLFGLGSLRIESSEIPITDLVLYMIPFIALAYDVYILAEDYKVKRIGLFVRTNKMFGACIDEVNWEKWVSNHRELIAAFASLVLSIISLIAATILIIVKKFDQLNINKNINLTAWGVNTGIWLAICIILTWLIVIYYKKLRARLRHALRDLAEIQLECNFEDKLNEHLISKDLEIELKKHLFPIPKQYSINRESIWKQDIKLGKKFKLEETSTSAILFELVKSKNDKKSSWKKIKKLDIKNKNENKSEGKKAGKANSSDNQNKPDNIDNENNNENKFMKSDKIKKEIKESLNENLDKDIICETVIWEIRGGNYLKYQIIKTLDENLDEDIKDTKYKVTIERKLDFFTF